VDALPGPLYRSTTPAGDHPVAVGCQRASISASSTSSAGARRSAARRRRGSDRGTIAAASAALHPKRPALIPTLDSVVQKYLQDDDLGARAPFGE
jgi:hypothetical protein